MGHGTAGAAQPAGDGPPDSHAGQVSCCLSDAGRNREREKARLPAGSHLLCVIRPVATRKVLAVTVHQPSMLQACMPACACACVCVLLQWTGIQPGGQGGAAAPPRGRLPAVTFPGSCHHAGSAAAQVLQARAGPLSRPEPAVTPQHASGRRNGKAREGQAILLFKKRMFRETDESITEAQFITLSFVQACLPGQPAVAAMP